MILYCFKQWFGVGFGAGFGIGFALGIGSAETTESRL
jgi:hypothetical protein